METNIFVEKYVKRKGGKFYCAVRFKIGKTVITVGEFATDDEQVAIRKAKEVLDTASNIWKV